MTEIASCAPRQVATGSARPVNWWPVPAGMTKTLPASRSAVAGFRMSEPNYRFEDVLRGLVAVPRAAAEPMVARPTPVRAQ